MSKDMLIYLLASGTIIFSALTFFLIREKAMKWIIACNALAATTHGLVLVSIIAEKITA